MRRIFAILLAGAALAALAAGPVAAAAPANPSCWGVVSAQRATSTGDIGEHASAQSTPRLGLGNTARLLHDLGLTGGPHVSDLGSTLAELDGIDATSCG
jgi:opacity protein-like surface antigen